LTGETSRIGESTSTEIVFEEFPSYHAEQEQQQYIKIPMTSPTMMPIFILRA
jgi:hypothetical protein